jgi:hypothetical protein
MVLSHILQKYVTVETAVQFIPFISPKKQVQFMKLYKVLCLVQLLLVLKAELFGGKKEVLLPQKSPQDKKCLQFLHKQLALG